MKRKNREGGRKGKKKNILETLSTYNNIMIII